MPDDSNTQNPCVASRKGGRPLNQELYLDTEELYLAGVYDAAIERRLGKRYGVVRRTVRQYLKRVRAKIGELPKPDPETSRRQIESMLRNVYEQSLSAEKPDFKAAVTAAQRLGELAGVLGKKTVEFTGANGARIGAVVFVPSMDETTLETPPPQEQE